MTDFRLSGRALVMTAGSSKGTQPKYYENGWWYKQNVNGYEGESEYLASLVLSCSDTSDYVTYEKCTINGRPGCRSRSFLGKDEAFFSFERLHMMAAGTHLEDAVRQYSDCSGRIAYVRDFLIDESGHDCSGYLSRILTLDALTLNCDRHFNNLGVIINAETGRWRDAPIFDNGDAFLSNYARFHADTLEKNLENVYARPFSSNHIRQALDAGTGLALDYGKLYSLLENEPDSRALEVLYRQLETCRDIIPVYSGREEQENAGYILDEEEPDL